MRSQVLYRAAQQLTLSLQQAVQVHSVPFAAVQLALDVATPPSRAAHVTGCKLHCSRYLAHLACVVGNLNTYEAFEVSLEQYGQYQY